MLTLLKAVVASGALIYGAANVQPVDIASPSVESPVATSFVFSPDHNAPDTFIRNVSSDSDAIVEQAAENFDDFAMQIPVVLGLKIQAVAKHGTKAIFMHNTESQPAEDKMIGALVKGLKNIGDAMASDMVQSAHNKQG